LDITWRCRAIVQEEAASVAREVEELRRRVVEMVPREELARAEGQVCVCACL
jgi:hypothetical protein